jgi:transcription factor WhiB
VTAVVDRSSSELAWPAWQVPASAVEEWSQLRAALAHVSEVPPCRRDPEAWFVGVQSPRLEHAVAGCLSCPVLWLCREYAIAADERDGVWGGTTPVERRVLAGRRR